MKARQPSPSSGVLHMCSLDLTMLWLRALWILMNRYQRDTPTRNVPKIVHFFGKITSLAIMEYRDKRCWHISSTLKYYFIPSKWSGNKSREHYYIVPLRDHEHRFSWWYYIFYGKFILAFNRETGNCSRKLWKHPFQSLGLWYVYHVKVSTVLAKEGHNNFSWCKE